MAYATRTAAGETGPLPVLSGSGYVVTGDRYVSIGVRVPGRIDRYFVEEGAERAARATRWCSSTTATTAPPSPPPRRASPRRAPTWRSPTPIWRAAARCAVRASSRSRSSTCWRTRRRWRAPRSQQLEAELAEAKVNLDYTTLRAPADGVVLAKLKEVGEIAVPGGFAGSGDLIRLANLTDMRAEVDVNEADLNRVQLGQPARSRPTRIPTRATPPRW